MAVENKYVNSLIAAGKMANNIFVSGQRPLVLRTSFDVAAADDAGSVYRLFKGLPTKTRIMSIEILNDAIAGATDVDLGLYATTLEGEVIAFDPSGSSVDMYDDAIDLSSAHSVTAPLVCMTNIDLSDFVKTIDEYFATTGGLDTDLEHYPTSVDLCLTFNSNPTAAGTILVNVVLAPEND